MAVSHTDLDAIRSWAASHPIIRRVWVFGSRVRGAGRPDSDLDVAVEHDALPIDSSVSATWINEAPIWRGELGPMLSVPLHLHPYIPGESPAIQAGLSESSFLAYERTV